MWCQADLWPGAVPRSDPQGRVSGGVDGCRADRLLPGPRLPQSGFADRNSALADAPDVLPREVLRPPSPRIRSQAELWHGPSAGGEAAPDADGQARAAARRASTTPRIAACARSGL